jgi:asparagine synthase (glutamine-hydrolysing)
MRVFSSLLMPVAAWLRGPLRDWAETLLDAQRLQEEAVLRPEWVRQLWRDFLSGRDALHYAVWTVLMFQAWQEGQRVTH